MKGVRLWHRGGVPDFGNAKAGPSRLTTPCVQKHAGDPGCGERMMMQNTKEANTGVSSLAFAALRLGRDDVGWGLYAPTHHNEAVMDGAPGRLG